MCVLPDLRERLAVSLAAVLAMLCLYYRQALRLLPPLLLAASVHELSHLLALGLLGLRVRALRFEPAGLCICYEGDCSARGHAVVAISGPTGGLLYAALSFLPAGDGIGLFFRQSAACSLILSLFNLLPILPLDGGRVFFILCTAAFGQKAGRRLYDSVSAALLAAALFAGVALAAWKKMNAPLAAGLWLLLLRNEPQTLVKSREVL